MFDFDLKQGGRPVGACGRVAAVAALGLALLPAPGHARGSFQRSEPWSSAPVSQLPPTVRSFVTSVCRNGIAKHSFASYHGGDRIVLHYERLHCADRPEQCGADGCLHQEYSFEHGGWHLARSYHERRHD
jgi:hypothetical protein